MRLLQVLLAATLALGLAAESARAQFNVVTDTVSAPLFPDRTSIENGLLNRFNMDREPQGGRARAMGGTGMALPGGPETHAQNPAAVLGLMQPELHVEGTYYSGSAGVRAFPPHIDVGAADLIDAREYRVNYRKVLYYNSLSGGIPLALLGKRSVFALSYRRVDLTGFQDESRATLQGSITNQAEAIYGVEDRPLEGMDAITATVARQVTPWLDLGVNLNWMSGMLKREGETGVSVLGNVFAEGSSGFHQEVEGFNLDVGGLVKHGQIRVGAAVYLGYDLDFHSGEYRTLTLTEPPAFQHRFLILGRPRDHTLSVPTSFGVGASYAVNPRLNVAADVLLRPWSNSEVTRSRVEAFVGFTDLADSSTFVQTLIPADDQALWDAAVNAGLITDGSVRTETFGTGFDDTNSLRLGVEYFLKQSEDFDLPVRIGFRKEKHTYNNLVEPATPSDTTYGGEIYEYWKMLQTDPECTTPECQASEAFLEQVMEYNQLMFQGDPVDALTLTLGFGVRISEWSADLSFERTSFDYDRFFLSAFDPITNPVSAISNESRTLLNITLSMRMRF